MTMQSRSDSPALPQRRPFAKRLLDGLKPSRLTVPTFLLAWSFLVIAPLVVIVLFSFLQVKAYRVIYTPSLDTWISLIDSGRWMAAVRPAPVLSRPRGRGPGAPSASTPRPGWGSGA